MSEKAKGTYDILAAIAYEKRREKWSMRESQLYYQIKQKIHDIPIEVLQMAEVLHQRADEQKGQVRSTKRAGKPIPQSSRRNGLT